LASVVNLDTYRPTPSWFWDDMHPPLARDSCIMANSGAFCRMQVKLQCWRHTDRHRQPRFQFMGWDLKCICDMFQLSSNIVFTESLMTCTNWLGIT